MHFKPKLFKTLKSYSKELFYKDLISGLLLPIVALPLAIAFAIASGVGPEKGLYTAIIGGFIISFFGGSKIHISGPTGAFIVIVYGIVQEFGVDGLAIATIMAGIMLVTMGYLKLGSVIKFIPFPVTVGFTSGIAVTIFSTQIKDLFGLQTGALPVDFLSKWTVYASNIGSTNLWATGVGFITILIIALSPKISKKIPGSLLAIILMTVIVYFLRENTDVVAIETIGDKFSIDASLPRVVMPRVSFELIQTLLPAAFTIAMLGAIVSLLSATVADGMTGDKHDSNTELIAQGIGNIVVPFFGGIPATGAVARTITNINNGGRTPIAGMIHAIVLLLILLFFGGLTKHIPMAALAGVLVIVSYNMSDWRTFRGLMKSSKSDVAVLVVTFLLTVIFDLTIAIELGLLLAVFLFIKRSSDTASISVFKDQIDEADYVEYNTDSEKIDLPNGVEVYEIEGPYFFGVATKFEETIKRMGNRSKVRIIRMRKVPFIDSTGTHNLANLIRMSKNDKTQILLSGVNENVLNSLKKAGIDKLLGAENICSNIYDAVERSKSIKEAYKSKRREEVD